MMNIDSPGVVAEMMAAFERHERALVSNDAGMLDGRLRADALSGPLSSPALLKNIGKTSTPDGRKPMSRRDAGRFNSRFSNLEPKGHNPGCRKRFRLRVEINDWRRL